MKNLVKITFLLWSFGAWAQTPQDIFEQGNTQYRNGKYSQAIKTYEQIESDGYQSAELYYNLGNAYYKLNKIAPSIYNYEKALQIDPSLKDAQNNLVFARRMAIDIIEPLPKTVFQRFNESVIYPISYNQWAWITIILAFLSSSLILGYYFSIDPSRKKLFFVTSFVSLGLFFMALSMGIKARHHYIHDKPAIVFATKVSVKSEPGNSSEESFVLHEGAKVEVLDQEENWYKIKIADGKTGWLKQDQIKLLK